MKLLPDLSRSMALAASAIRSRLNPLTSKVYIYINSCLYIFFLDNLLDQSKIYKSEYLKPDSDVGEIMDQNTEFSKFTKRKNQSKIN